MAQKDKSVPPKKKMGPPFGSKNRLGKTTTSGDGQFEIVLAEALKGRRGKQIAETTGLKLYQVYELQSSQKFKDRIATEREKRRAALMNEFEELSHKAATMHEQIFTATEVPPNRDMLRLMSLKLEAANSILDRVGFGRETKVKQDVQQTTTITNDFDGRSNEDLKYYAINGHFPEEAPKKKESHTQ